MMMHVGLNEKLKSGIWPERAATANKLKSITANPNEEK